MEEIILNKEKLSVMFVFILLMSIFIQYLLKVSH